MKFYLSNFICLLSLVQVSNNDVKDLFEKVFKSLDLSYSKNKNLNNVKT